MFMRLANIAFAAAGVVFTYLLARDLSGGVRRIGVAAAAIAALVPQGHTLFSEAMNDGLGFAAGDGRRMGRRPVHRHRRRPLGAQLTSSCSARPRRRAPGRAAPTLLVAVVVVVWVAVARLLTAAGRLRPGGRRSAAPSPSFGLRPGCRAVRLALRPQQPAVRRLRRVGVPPRPVRPDAPRLVVRGPHVGAPVGRPLPHADVAVAAVHDQGPAWRQPRACCSSPSGWSSWRSAAAPETSCGAASMASSPGRRSGCVSSVVVVVIVTVAQHVSGGGSRYARYLLPALGRRRRPVRPRPRSPVAAGPARRHRGADGVVGAAQRAVGRRSDRRAATPRPGPADAGAAPGAAGEPVAAHRRRSRDRRRLRCCSPSSLASTRVTPCDRQAGVMITLPLCPPKPKLLEIVGPGSHGRPRR